MNFYSIIQHLHSGWAYITVLLGLIFFFTTSFFALSKKTKTKTLTKISFYTTLAFHLQLVIGVILYFVSPYAKWTENTMKDDTSRLYAMEHPLMMFAAVIFVTIANSKLKKTETVKIPIAILALFAIVFVLSRIPWTAWLG